MSAGASCWEEVEKEERLLALVLAGSRLESEVVEELDRPFRRLTSQTNW